MSWGFKSRLNVKCTGGLFLGGSSGGDYGVLGYFFFRLSEFLSVSRGLSQWECYEKSVGEVCVKKCSLCCK